MTPSYEQAVAQLLSLADFERKARANDSPDFHIRRTAMLLERLGNPQDSVPAIHVAGSKGKGSTSAMIAAGLSANGLRTGMFVSPHLHRMTERFTVDGAPISRHEFVSLFERIWPEAEEMRESGEAGSVSVFEFQTAMAFLHFADVNADAMVIEVGLGGRLDSTNVITPRVSVITPVGFDHVAVLGDTIDKIATEKAGIIKEGVPVVTARQVPGATDVIWSTSKRLNAPLVLSESIRLVSEDPNGPGPQLLKFVGKSGSYNISLPLLGEHQVENVRSAIAATETFASSSRHHGSSINAAQTALGISNVKWPGRVQLLETASPLLIVDGAHNHDSAEALRNALERHFGMLEQIVLVLGATGGHDPLSVARVFADLSPKVVVTSSRHPKAVDPGDFAEALCEDKIDVAAVTRSTEQALTEARQICPGSGVIVAAGSLFVAAEVIESVSGIEPEIYPDMRRTVGPVRLAGSETAAPATPR